MPEKFSAKKRRNVLEDCRDHPPDIIIVGGGITGAGILRDATLRGMRAALFEANDFGFGTSSRSSKLIHGGLRYLETFDWKLVFESCRERKILLKQASPYVKPLRFAYPVYRGQRRNLLTVALGVFLYEALALFRNVAAPRIRLPKNTLLMQPNLREDGLTGSVAYSDASTHDLGLAIATISSAWKAGGLAVNHAEVSNLLTENEKVVGAEVVDGFTGEKFKIRSRWVVNATGPWSDLFRERSQLDTQRKLRLTRGIHLVLPNEVLSPKQALLLLAPSDGRVTFVIPWEGFTLVGTTDTDYEGDPSQVSATPAEVDYLLETVNHYFPSRVVYRSDVISTYAGLRPLLKPQQESNAMNPSQVSREHQIFSDQKGFLTVSGGKYTTFRLMAAQAVDWLCENTPGWKGFFQGSTTLNQPLDVLPYEESSGGSPLVPGLPTDWDRIQFAVEEEMAATVSDVLTRRTFLTFFDRNHGERIAGIVAKYLADRLGYEKRLIDRQLEEHHQDALYAQSGLGR